MINSKASLRKHFLQIRKAISQPDAAIAATKVADIFLKNINLNSVKNIALYQPVNGEIDPENLAIKILSENPNINFSLPVITAADAPLLFHSWKYGEKLIKNSLYPKIFEPENTGKNLIPEIIIVPLVAFDTSCRRLGYGGGFYDRTLMKFKAAQHKIRTIGYAYECQKSTNPIPSEAHDIALDFIITEKQVYP